MFRPVEAFIGTRYIYARRGNHFIAFMSLTSIIATALGVAILLTILSIMNGFEGELRNRILGMASHLVVEADASLSADWPALFERISAHRTVLAAAPYISRDVLLSHRGIVRAVEARGVAPEFEQRVTSIAAHMRDGGLDRLERGTFRIVIGRELADAFGLALGDRITLIAPQPIMTPAGLLPRLKRFEVVGIFEFGLHEHDSGLALIDLTDAQRLFRTGARVDGVRATLEDPSLAPVIRQELAVSLGTQAPHMTTVTDWTETHRNLFRALKVEKIVMFSILAIAIGIAAFNIVSILVMAVTEKRPDVAMLTSLGMDRASVMRVFFVQGGLTGVAGVCAGLIVGVLLSVNVGAISVFIEQLFGFKILSPDVYYISNIRSELRLSDLLATTALATLLSLGAPLYPAWLAASSNVCDGLGYE